MANVGEIGKYLCKIFRNCKKAFRKSPNDIIGESKTLWDLSAIGYVIEPKWFKTQKVSCPKILDDTTYVKTENEHKITFVNDLNRHEIYKDFFIKMGYKNEEIF